MTDERIPSLDGIRAVAVWLTIAHHLAGRFGLVFENPLLSGIAKAGDGVGIFFVLSGFLITLLLVREHERTDRVDFTAFWIRRAFRILPPLYTYLGFALLFAWALDLPARAEPFLSAALFYRDYSPAPPFFPTEHTWSLSVEEQFYLLWPPLLLVALRRGGRPAAARVGMILVLITPLLRVIGNAAGIASFHHHDTVMLHTRMDALMSGAVVALMAGTPGFERWYRRYARVWWLGPLYTLLLSGLLQNIDRPLGATTFGVAYGVTLGLTVDAVLIALFILWASRNASSLVGRMLNHPVVIWMGVLSYSAYLWQTAFIHPANGTLLARWPWLLIYIWVAAAATHFLIERPALRCRRHIERLRARRGAWPAARGASPPLSTG